MANHIAVELDRRGLAEMSCIAGVGGDVKALVRVARSGRAIIALDGCALHCVGSCLARHGVEPTLHHTFSHYGVRKLHHQSFDPVEAEEVLARVVSSLSTAGEDEPRVVPGVVGVEPR
jgi:uncharacterized metal-binding protein